MCNRSLRFKAEYVASWTMRELSVPVLSCQICMSRSPCSSMTDACSGRCTLTAPFTYEKTNHHLYSQRHGVLTQEHASAVGFGGAYSRRLNAPTGRSSCSLSPSRSFNWPHCFSCSQNADRGGCNYERRVDSHRADRRQDCRVASDRRRRGPPGVARRRWSHAG